MEDPAASSAATVEALYALTVDLRLQADGPVVTSEPVTGGDLSDCRNEVLLETCLRKGQRGVTLDDLDFRVLPGHRDGSESRYQDFALEATEPDGGTGRRWFTIHALADVAERASKRLLRDGVLKDGELYYYGVTLERRRAGDPGPAALRPPEAAPFTVTARRRAPTFLSLPLRTLLERAEALGPQDGDWFPVFYTRDAFAKAERFSRRGAASDPPVETGAVLVGPVCSCPETAELFVVVCEVIELIDARQNEFSLTYSGATWTHVQAVVRAMQSEAPTRAYRIVGQSHGHNFLPHYLEQKSCEECEKRASCELTSVFVSNADRTWSRAVFTDQPWATCHIFGHGARAEEVHGLFGLRDGRLLRRGFHVIADFDPAAACEGSPEGDRNG